MKVNVCLILLKGKSMIIAHSTLARRKDYKCENISFCVWDMDVVHMCYTYVAQQLP